MVIGTIELSLRWRYARTMFSFVRSQAPHMLMDCSIRTAVHRRVCSAVSLSWFGISSGSAFSLRCPL